MNAEVLANLEKMIKQTQAANTEYVKIPLGKANNVEVEIRKADEVDSEPVIMEIDLEEDVSGLKARLAQVEGIDANGLCVTHGTDTLEDGIQLRDYNI